VLTMTSSIYGQMAKSQKFQKYNENRINLLTLIKYGKPKA
jgi:hypothetical protein